jgi:hypothetical protein
VQPLLQPLDLPGSFAFDGWDQSGKLTAAAPAGLRSEKIASVKLV